MLVGGMGASVAGGVPPPRVAAWRSPGGAASFPDRSRPWQPPTTSSPTMPRRTPDVTAQSVFIFISFPSFGCVSMRASRWALYGSGMTPATTLRGRIRAGLRGRSLRDLRNSEAVGRGPVLTDLGPGPSPSCRTLKASRGEWRRARRHRNRSFGRTRRNPLLRRVRAFRDPRER